LLLLLLLLVLFTPAAAADVYSYRYIPSLLLYSRRWDLHPLLVLLLPLLQKGGGGSEGGRAGGRGGGQGVT